MLTQFVIYESPSDYPEKWVVRRWKINSGKITPEACSVCNTLEEARQIIPEGMVNIGRYPDDDPSIYETWT